MCARSLHARGHEAGRRGDERESEEEGYEDEDGNEDAPAAFDDGTGGGAPLRRLTPYRELVVRGRGDAGLGTGETRRRARAPADDAEMPAAKQQKGDLG